MKIKVNNDYKCFMSIPNINYWYEDDKHLFIGWLFWGIDIVLSKPKVLKRQNSV